MPTTRAGSDMRKLTLSKDIYKEIWTNSQVLQVQSLIFQQEEPPTHSLIQLVLKKLQSDMYEHFEFPFKLIEMLFIKQSLSKDNI